MRTALLSLILFISVANAEPARVEAQAGICKHGLAGRGIWWNDTYPTTTDANSSCWQLGLSKIHAQWRQFNVGWRTAYVEVGRIEAENVFTMHDSEQFSGISGAHCNAKTLKGCLGAGSLTQRTRGLSFGGFLEDDFGQWTLGIEGGMYAYHGDFRVVVKAHPDPGKFEAIAFRWDGFGLTPYLGLTARQGLFFVTGRVYGNVVAHESGCSGCTGISDGRAWQLTVGVQSSF